MLVPAYMPCMLARNAKNLTGAHTFQTVPVQDEETGRPDMSHEEQSQRPKYLWASDTNAALSLQLTYAFVLCAVCPIAPVMLYIWVIRCHSHPES